MIGIVGDLHIAPVPVNRIDDYFNVGLRKITEIAKNCNHVVFLGDIFSKPKVEELYVYKLIKCLLDCKRDYHTDFYTIIGNHDVPNELEEKLNESSLGLLKISNAINVITPDNPVKIGNFMFNTIPVNFVKAKEYLQNKKYNDNDILLVHHEYEIANNSLTYEDFREVNCKIIFLGHDHKPFDEGRIVYPEFTVYRSGSLMRNIAIDYNFNRPVYYFTIIEGRVSCKEVNVEKAEEVFKVEALTRQNYNNTKFLESLEQVIDKYKNVNAEQVQFSIKAILQELNAPKDIIEYVKTKYDLIGESFN